MMMHRTSILSMTSLAIALLFASFLHVETARLRRAIRAIEFESPAPKLELEPPSKQSSAGGTTAARVVGHRRRDGLGATSTTTATERSITTTTTMMAEDDEMSPSEFYMLHHREHGLALAEEAAASASAEENHDEDEEERELRQQWRRRCWQQRRRLAEIVKRQRERQQEEEEIDDAESEQWNGEEEEEQVETQHIGGTVETVEESASPTGDGDGDGHDDDDNASVIAGPPFSPPSSNPDSAVDGSDVSIDITDDCNVTYPTLLGDGHCYNDDGYNTAECGWDGGDCCYQTCRDGSVYRCGLYGYDCRDPRFSDIVYDEEGERDPQRRRERQALKALYDATNGKGWYDQGRWLNDTLDHCYWHPWRIKCTGGEGYVWWIDLGNNLNGTLPTEIGDLVHLELLWLFGNEHLTGTIPASIGQLTELIQLDVSDTSLSGPVPANVMVPIFGTPREYYSPDSTDDYAELSPHDCADVFGWTDADGHGCDWYSNDTSSCATDGAPLGDTGHAADMACCACGVWGAYVQQREPLEVLKELYRATNGGDWHNSSLWMNSSVTHCNWTGVQCNDSGMVTNITLPSNNLRGNLPTSIGELPSLRILDVSDNRIAGYIPTELYTLPNLEGLHLQNCNLDGSIPTQLAQLTVLRRLDLGHNGLTGPIPVAITDMSLVEDLRLSHNRLTGTISPEFRRMSRLKRLDIDNNRLEGSIPVDIGLLSLLRELRISNQEGYWDGSSLSGPIPVELGDCQYLEVLDLSDNGLTGVLPTELARLARMKSLQLHDNEFEGFIPSEYGLLPSLENLTLGVYDWREFEYKIKPAPLSLCFNGAFDLHSDPSWCPPERNALKGLYDAAGGDGWSNNANWTDPYSDHCSWYGVGCSVRVSCRNVQNWTDTYDEGCDWYGLDPDYCKEYGDAFDNENNTANTACCVCQQEKLGCFWNGTECIKDHVTSLSLNSNGLSGSLPAELGQLTHLERLYLSNNALVGAPPSDIVDLTKLRLLDLTGNALSGGFPEEIANLPSLSEVHLSRNELSGELSINAGNNPSKLTMLHFANNKFGGELSAAFTQLSNFPYLREIDMSYNSFHGSIPSTPMDGITKLTVGGNERMTAPIPSSLCHSRTLDLDLQYSPVHCPVLSFLRLFNDSTNGTSWNWEGVAGVCDEWSWHGIKCDETNTSIVTINLSNHGLSGTLPDSFGEHMSALSFLRVLDLSNNDLSGRIPLDLARLSLLEEVRLANNRFSGTLLAQISNLPRLKVLDMDNNRLTGALPIEYGRLSSLRELRLSENCLKEIDSSTGNITMHGLRGEIPVEWGNLANVEHLDLSGNFLTGSIPAALGNLGGLAELLLRNNSLVGLIPSALGRLTQIEVLALNDNSGLEKLAPLSVCALPDNSFDLKSENSYCPLERDVLKKLYSATNGDSWADTRNWLDEYDHPCNSTKNWFGISCNTELMVHSINLTGNGLYGTLGSEILQLVELQELKLGDNRLYGNLPDFIPHTKLEVLQLSGNDFSGEIPESIVNLARVSMLRLHANKFTKGLPSTAKVHDVTLDCGDPYYHGDGKLAENGCTICCNSEGKCREVTNERLSLGQKTGLYMGCLIAFLLIFWAVVFLMNKKVDLPKPPRDAIECCGPDSVYSFGLAGGYWPDRFFLLLLSALTIAAQFGIITVFLHASDVSKTSNDWEYYLRCPFNQLECHSDLTVNWKGWVIFAVIMLAFLGKDLVNGVMLVYNAGLRGRTRCFLSGVIITSLTCYTLWTSTQYNLAIARTNTSLIANAVIILFVNEMDEKIYELSQWLLPDWVAGVMHRSDLADSDDSTGEKDKHIDEFRGMIENQEQKISSLEKKLHLHIYKIPDIGKHVRPMAGPERVSFSKKILLLEQEWLL